MNLPLPFDRDWRRRACTWHHYLGARKRSLFGRAPPRRFTSRQHRIASARPPQKRQGARAYLKAFSKASNRVCSDLSFDVMGVTGLATFSS